jgi:hypothetical protein
MKSLFFRFITFFYLLVNVYALPIVDVAVDVSFANDMLSLYNGYRTIQGVRQATLDNCALKVANSIDWTARASEYVSGLPISQAGMLDTAADLCPDVDRDSLYLSMGASQDVYVDGFAKVLEHFNQPLDQWCKVGFGYYEGSGVPIWSIVLMRSEECCDEQTNAKNCTK